MTVRKPFLLGVGLSSRQNEVDSVAPIVAAMCSAGIDTIAGVATIDKRAAHPLIVHLADYFNADIFAFSPQELEAQTPRLANPSPRLYARIGCHSVAEAAALASAGRRARLVIEKTTYQHVSFAIAQTCIVSARENPKG